MHRTNKFCVQCGMSNTNTGTNKWCEIGRILYIEIGIYQPTNMGVVSRDIYFTTTIFVF